MEEIRARWADWVNYTYEKNGHTERIHPRSLRARDITRKPEPKVGYSRDPAMHEERERIRAERNLQREQEQASQGWEYRKARLHISDVQTIEPREFLQAGYIQAHQTQKHTWDKHAPSWKAQHDYRMMQQLTGRLQWHEQQATRLAYERQANTHRIQTLETQIRLAERQLSREREHSRLPQQPGRAVSPERSGVHLEDDLVGGGLRGPGLDRKRGRDGYEW
jgi:hypothetical protein